MILTISQLLNAEQLAAIRRTLAQIPFEDGRATAGHAAKRVKNNQQARRDEPELQDINRAVTQALQQSPLFQSFALPHRTTAPIFSRYQPDMSYGDHVDNAIMPGTPPVRSDLSLTLFLSEPDEYDGGELLIDTDLNPQTVKLPAGSMVVYPSSTLHRVAPVRHGERLVAVAWVQSLVRDHARRQMLFEFGRALRALEDKSPQTREALQLSKIRTNLLRMWTEL